MALALCIVASLTAFTSSAFAGDSSGFYWGADSFAPYPNTDSGNPCPSSSRPFLEPWVTAPSGGCGAFGVDYGEIFGYWNIPDLGCTGIDAYSGAAIAAAAANEPAYGIGPGGYYFAAGPGIDPNYNGTTAEAYSWGQEQGRHAVNSWESHPDITTAALPLVIDVEVAASDGWNVINKGCSGVGGYGVAPAIDRATLNGIYNYIINNGIAPAVYSSPGEWASIFGTSSEGNLNDTMEWTADYGPYATGCAQYAPLQWTQTYQRCGGYSSNSAQFFGGISSGSSCAWMWQWASPDNETRDYDQVDKDRLGICN